MIEFQCAICFSDCPIEQKYTFPICKHSFCKPCLKGLFEQKIKEQDAKPESYCCPQCAIQFDTVLLQDLVSQKSFENFSDNAIKYLMIQGNDNYEVMVDCFNDRCNQKFVVWKDADYIFCEKCNKKYCFKCKLEYHDPKVITCDQLKAQKREAKEEELYKAAKKNPALALCKCPKCGVYVQRIGGCNYMTCKCGQHFCFLCDIKLSAYDHDAHFKNNYALSNECRVWQDGKWVDRDKARPEPIKQPEPAPPPVEVIKEDPIPICLNCGSYDKYITKYVMDTLIYQCNSIKCQSRYICTRCKQIIKQNELADHLNSKFHIDNI